VRVDELSERDKLEAQVELLRIRIMKMARLMLDDMRARAGQTRLLTWEERTNILDELLYDLGGST